MDETAAQRRITAFWDAVASQYDTTDNANIATQARSDDTYWAESVRSE